MADPTLVTPRQFQEPAAPWCFPAVPLGRGGLGIFMRKGQRNVPGGQGPERVASTCPGESLLGVGGQLVCPLRAKLLDQMSCEKGDSGDRSGVPGCEGASFPAVHRPGPALGNKGLGRPLREPVTRPGSTRTRGGA